MNPTAANPTVRGTRGPAPKNPPGVIWCCNRRSGEPRYRWAFPTKVSLFIQRQIHDGSSLHLFGGHAAWGIRMDIDPAVKPDVYADACRPPFAAGSFDHVILDPPYSLRRQPEIRAVLTAALWCADKTVWWFHTVWVPPIPGLQLQASWQIRVGSYAAIRVLEKFSVTAPSGFRKEPYGRLSRETCPAWKENP